MEVAATMQGAAKTIFLFLKPNNIFFPCVISTNIHKSPQFGLILFCVCVSFRFNLFNYSSRKEINFYCAWLFIEPNPNLHPKHLIANTQKLSSIVSIYSQVLS